MPIKVVLADDSDVMRQAIKRLLKEESRLEIVGQASSFTSTMQMVVDLKPDVLLMDLHMPQKRNFSPLVVKSQIQSVPCTIAISFANDQEAQALAHSYGAVALLDKMCLYSDLATTIFKFCDDGMTAPPQSAVPPKPDLPAECGG